MRWDANSFYPGGPGGVQAETLSQRSSSATGEIEYEPCPYYQTLGFCLEPELCPRVHEFLPDYFSESSDDDENEEISSSQSVTPAYAALLEAKQGGGESQTSVEFLSSVAKCSCCLGNPKKCSGDICKSLGICKCVAENFHDMM